MLAVLTVLAAVCAIAGMTACSSSTPAEPLPDATGLIQQSIQSTKKLTSAHLDIAVTGTIEGLPVKELSGDLTNTPTVAISGNAMISMGGSNVDIQLVVLDGTLYAALSPNSWLDMGPAADIYDPSVVLNPDNGLANMLSSLSEATSDDAETINNIPTIRISGEVSADAINKLVPQINATQALQSTVWIQADAPHQLVRAIVEQSEGNTIQLTLSEWDKPVTVTKPAL